MRALLALVLVLAVASQASAWKLYHKKHRTQVCNPKQWDRVFEIKGENVIDPAKGQFAQKALNTVLVQTTAKMIAEGILPKGSRWVAVQPHAACYDSIVPGSLLGRQYLGEYEFFYTVAYKVPGVKGLVAINVIAASYNRRHFPWFEVIEAHVW